MSNQTIQSPISPEETETWMDNMVLEQDVVEKPKMESPGKIMVKHMKLKI